MVIGALSVAAGCGDDGSSANDGAGGSGAGGPSAGGGQPHGGGTEGGGGIGEGGGTSQCEPFGHFPAPETTFTLPTDGPLYYPDVQAAFPEVDWATLDRLYVPAGDYLELNLGNLPDRTEDRPLVITNLGGRVKVGPNPGANYIWSMSGGSHWILTGRYDPDAQTGDVSAPGHRCGAYATSRGAYGFLSDDGFDDTGAYLHMGIAVSDATDFEVEFVEVTRSGFAGIRFLNQANGSATKPMANVSLHDSYVHDVGGEGIYLGWTGAPPSNLLPGLQVYNNRFVRTGNEALQVQNLGEGSRVANNAIVHAGLHFRDNGLGLYQDHNSQINVRSGSVVVEKNVFIGSGAELMSLWRGEEAGDGPADIVVRDNYFAESRSGSAGYLGGSAGSGSHYTMERNFFRSLAFSYTEIDPSATDPKILFGVNGAVTAPIAFDDNRWEGDESLTYGLPADGTAGAFVASGNVHGPVDAIAFTDALDVSGDRIEFWVAATTLAPGSPPRTYAPGDVVLFRDGNLYRATAASTAAPPPDHPEAWELLETPKDDYRVPSGSMYETMSIE